MCCYLTKNISAIVLKKLVFSDVSVVVRYILMRLLFHTILYGFFYMHVSRKSFYHGMHL